MKTLSIHGCGCVAGMMLAILPVPATALIPEPDVIFYGEAINSEGTITSGLVSLRLDSNSATIASYRLGADPRARNRYVLRVPMDALDPRGSGTVRPGESAGIYLDGTLLKSVIIPAKGSAIAMSGTTDLTDSDGDGLSDAWEQHHFGTLARDGKGDLNRNGVSDLQEYQNGSDPGACAWMPVDDTHAEAVVDHPLVLKNCLQSAESDLNHNLIKLSQGTYTGNFTYTPLPGEDFDLRLVGGYFSDNLDLQRYPVELTTIDGDTDGDGISNGRVITLDSETGKTAGGIAIEGVHFKHGKAPAGESGGGILAKSYQGDIRLLGNRVSESSATRGGGIALASNSGQLLLSNNLLYANTAESGAALSVTTITGAVTLLNNTIASNTGSSAGNAEILEVESSGGGVDLTNNIISGGSGEPDRSEMYINSYGISIPLLVRNNSFRVGAMATNVPGFSIDPSNLDLLPLFIDPAASDYHLQKSSACIDAGYSEHPQISLRDMDGEARIYGKGRISGAAVDMGADEQSIGTGLDLNGDGTLGLGDAIKIYRSVRGSSTLTLEEKQKSDVAPLGADGLPQGNGVVDVADVILIIRWLIGLDSW